MLLQEKNEAAHNSVQKISKSTFNISTIVFLTCVSYVHSACPRNFTEAAGGICLLVVQSKGTYCYAHSFCETEGKARGLRLFLPGRHIALIHTVLPPNSVVYSGISAFLNRSADLLEGWRYSDPGWAWYTTSSRETTVPWDVGEPNDQHASVAIVYFYKIWDDLQFLGTTTHVVCELSGISDINAMEPFKKNWPYSMSSLFFAHLDAIGCFTFTVENTLLKCCYR